jgi:hypothetical protein
VGGISAAHRLPCRTRFLLKLSEALCHYIHVRQIRLGTLGEKGEDRGGECSAQCVGLDRPDVCTVEARESLDRKLVVATRLSGR